MDFVTVLGDFLHLVVTVPVFGVGVAVGAVAYRIILKKDPAALAKLVEVAHTELNALATATAAKAAAATTPASAVQADAKTTASQ